MFVHHVAYRYGNGHLEEFAGAGLTQSAARRNSVNSAIFGVGQSQREPFALERVIDLEQLPTEERARLHAAMPARFDRSILV